MAMIYDEAARRLGRRESVGIDKVRGTEFRRAPGEAGMRGDIQVRYRTTPVVTLHPDNTYTVRTGGFASKTVIKRITEYSPVTLVKRGNALFYEGEGGKLLRFFEGTKFDLHGRAVDVPDTGRLVVQPAAASDGDGDTPSAPRSTVPVIDEARLRAYIRRVVMEVMSEDVQPAVPMAGAPRQVTVRAVTKAATPAQMVPLDMVERLIADAAGDRKKAERLIKDLRNSMTRGRDRSQVNDAGAAADVLSNLPDASEDGTRPATTVVGVKCGKCDTALVLHYDRANRYRGCDYALEHMNDSQELIR